MNKVAFCGMVLDNDLWRLTEYQLARSLEVSKKPEFKQFVPMYGHERMFSVMNRRQVGPITLVYYSGGKLHCERLGAHHMLQAVSTDE